MKTARICAATLLTGAILAAPAAAGADPWLTAESGDTIFVEGDNDGTLGAVIDIHGWGCSNNGLPAYMGNFASLVDPIDDPDAFQLEFETNADGEFHVQGEMIADANTYHARWYCSTTPIGALDDADLWISPRFSMTLTEPVAVQGIRQVSAIRSVGAKAGFSSVLAATAAPASAEPTLEVTVDPDALPIVDRMGIHGPQAAQLKDRVDQAGDASRKLQNLIGRATGRNADAGHSDNAEYVKTAFKVLTGKGAPPKTMAPYVARLDDGGLRVQVVEDIALTERDAAWWNGRS